MADEYMANFNGMQRTERLRVLARCNALSARFGLCLTQEQMQGLSNARAESLRQTGRVEFGPGVLEKLVYAFCDSPYVQQEDYADTLAALQDAFYYFKGEAMERITDDELIGYMKAVFDGAAQGSIDYLTQTSLETLSRMARTGDLPDGCLDEWILCADPDDSVIPDDLRKRYE